MANGNLKMFMRPDMKCGDVVDIVIKDKNGNDMPLKMKRLSQKRISEIRAAYTTTNPVYDKRNQPIIRNGKIMMATERDESAMIRCLITEALVQPPLDDPELMEYYDVLDVNDMPDAVFTQDELVQIITYFNQIVNHMELDSVSSEDVEDAKN